MLTIYFLQKSFGFTQLTPSAVNSPLSSQWPATFCHLTIYLSAHSPCYLTCLVF